MVGKGEGDGETGVAGREVYGVEVSVESLDAPR